MWGRSWRELRFNIFQVRATDSHRHTELSLILIKNSCVWARHTGTLVHYSSESEWQMNQAPCISEICIFLPYKASFSFGVLCRSVCVCAAISVCLSLSVCLPPARPPPISPMWEGIPSTQRSKSRHLRKICLLWYWHCYSAILLHFLTRSISLNPCSS